MGEGTGLFEQEQAADRCKEAPKALSSAITASGLGVSEQPLGKQLP